MQSKIDGTSVELLVLWCFATMLQRVYYREMMRVTGVTRGVTD